jgi:hypothetical protein
MKTILSAFLLFSVFTVSSIGYCAADGGSSVSATLPSPEATLLKNEFVITESGGGMSGTQSSTSTQTGISFKGEYHRALNPAVQIGALVGYSRNSFESNSIRRVSTGFDFGALATLNFGTRISNAYFLRALVSRFVAAQSDRANSTSSVTAEVRLGKRFELVPQVSFAPYLFAQGTSFENSTSTSYGIQLLSASVHW